jgi:hypothetical protein
VVGSRTRIGLPQRLPDSMSSGFIGSVVPLPSLPIARGADARSRMPLVRNPALGVCLGDSLLRGRVERPEDSETAGCPNGHGRGSGWARSRGGVEGSEQREEGCGTLGDVATGEPVVTGVEAAEETACSIRA